MAFAVKLRFKLQVREHAAGVLANLMKGGDEELSKAFRERSYAEAEKILTKRKQRFLQLLSSILNYNFVSMYTLFLILFPCTRSSGSRLSMIILGLNIFYIGNQLPVSLL
jgi:hypothetical protein